MPIDEVSLTKLKYAKDLPDNIKSMFDSVEQIEKLAEESIIPHYRLANPATKGVKYLFFTTELKRYLVKNCISEVEGKKLTVCSVGGNAMPLQQRDIPKEICGVNNTIFSLPLTFVNSPSGVYFLYDDDNLVYIGQSTNVAGRIISHFREERKVFNRVFFMSVDVKSLNAVESKLIDYFRPKYNNTIRRPKNCDDGDFDLNDFLFNMAI